MVATPASPCARPIGAAASTARCIFPARAEIRGSSRSRTPQMLRLHAAASAADNASLSSMSSVKSDR